MLTVTVFYRQNIEHSRRTVKTNLRQVRYADTKKKVLTGQVGTWTDELFPLS